MALGALASAERANVRCNASATGLQMPAQPCLGASEHARQPPTLASLGNSGNGFRALSFYQPTAIGGASSSVSDMDRSRGRGRTQTGGAALAWRLPRSKFDVRLCHGIGQTEIDPVEPQ